MLAPRLTFIVTTTLATDDDDHLHVRSVEAFRQAMEDTLSENTHLLVPMRRELEDTQVTKVRVQAERSLRLDRAFLPDGPWVARGFDWDTGFALVETANRGTDVPDQGYPVAQAYSAAIADAIAELPEIGKFLAELANDPDVDLGHGRRRHRLAQLLFRAFGYRIEDYEGESHANGNGAEVEVDTPG